MQKIKYISLITIILLNISCSGYFLKRHYSKGFTFLKVKNNNYSYNFNSNSDFIIKKINNEYSLEFFESNLISMDNYNVGPVIYNNVLSNNSKIDKSNILFKKTHIHDTLKNPIKTKSKMSYLNINQDENKPCDKGILYKNFKFNLYLFSIAFLFYLILYFITMDFFAFLLYALLFLLSLIVFINFVYNIIKYFIKLKDKEIERGFIKRFVLFNLLLLFLLILIINGLYFGFGFFGYLYFF